jgi:hypothetical protein
MKKIEIQFQWKNKSYRFKKSALILFTESENYVDEIKTIVEEVNQDIQKVLIEKIIEVDVVPPSVILQQNELKDYLIEQWNNIKLT